jgi:hypothetical protein
MLLLAKHSDHHRRPATMLINEPCVSSNPWFMQGTLPEATCCMHIMTMPSALLLALSRASLLDAELSTL